LDSIPQLQPVLATFWQTGTISQAATKRASRALYQYLLPKLSPTLHVSVRDFSRTLPWRNGVAILQFLYRFAGLKHTEYQLQTRLELDTIANQPDETFREYNPRFNFQCDLASLAGLELSDSDRIDRYLRSILHFSSPVTSSLVTQHRLQRQTDRDTGVVSILTLSLLQERLLEHEEDHHMSMNRSFFTASRPPSPIWPNDDDHSSQDAETTSSLSPSAPPYDPHQPTHDIACYGCGGNHYLKDCPTTSPAQRHAIYASWRTPDFSTATEYCPTAAATQSIGTTVSTTEDSSLPFNGMPTASANSVSAFPSLYDPDYF
jgi:hypothetical protein